MRITMTIAGLALAVTSQTAFAATERFRCGRAGTSPTTVEIDRDAKTVVISEDGNAKIDRVGVCASFARILDDAAAAAAPRCSVAFDKTIVGADYISTAGPLNFVIAIALNTQAMTLTSYARIGDGPLTETVPCRPL